VGTTAVKLSYTLTKQKHASLSIKTLGDQKALVYINDKDIGLTPLTINREPGSHTLVVKLDGYEDFNETLSLKAGDHVNRTINLIPESTGDTSGYLLGTYISLGVGGASLIGAGIFHGLALSSREDANAGGQKWSAAEDTYAGAQTQMSVSYALYGVGGAALTTSIVLLILDLTQSDSGSSASLSLAPNRNPAHIGASMAPIYTF